MNTNRDHLVTIRELSKALSISVRTLRGMISRGEIPTIRVGKGTMRFDLDDAINALKKPTNGNPDKINSDEG